MLQTQVNYWSLQEQKRHNLVTEEASQLQAIAGLQQASAALQNVDVNRQNALTNAKNAEINAKNALINESNAQINARNAATQEYKAVTERTVGLQQAQAALTNAATQQFLSESQSLLNAAKTSETKASTNLKKRQADTELATFFIKEAEASVAPTKQAYEVESARLKTYEQSLNALKMGSETGKNIMNIIFSPFRLGL